MKKILIFSFIFSLIMLCFSNLVQATGIDMNLSSNSASDGTVYGSNTNTNTDSNTNTNSNTNVGSSLSTTFPVGSTAALSSSDLSLSNILNIILIVLGILLVIFAIAILTRMR